MAVCGDPNVFCSTSNVKSANIFDMVVKGFKCLKPDLIVILHHSNKISLQSDRSLVWLPNYQVACFKYLEQVYIGDVLQFCYLSWERDQINLLDLDLSFSNKSTIAIKSC